MQSFDNVNKNWLFINFLMSEIVFWLFAIKIVWTIELWLSEVHVVKVSTITNPYNIWDQTHLI